MISVTWMPNKDKDVLEKEYLECRNEEAGNEPRENRVDVVKVYFYTRADIIMVINENLGMAIARQIFSHREKYGKELTGWLEVFPDKIYFHTGTFARLIKEEQNND